MKTRLVGLAAILIAAFVFLGCDVVDLIVNTSQTQTQGQGGASPSPPPSSGGCVLGSLSIAPIAGTADPDVAPNVTVVFQIELLDTNAPPRPIADACSGAFTISTRVDASPAGACDAVARDTPQPSVRTLEPGACALTATAGDKSTTYTLNVVAAP
jgi:hypothetical protein